MQVHDVDSNTSLGVVADIIKTGANDVYIVRTPNGQEILIPAIEQVVQEIDFEGNRLSVRLLPGLLPDQ